VPAEQSSVKTFHARRGRMTTTRAHILENVLPHFELPAGDGALDLRQILNSPEVIVDFGCGMGDATLSLLEVGHSVLALDVHTPGICRIAEVAKDSGFQNLALVHGDGIPVLQERIVHNSIKSFLVLFPDPWPKAKHNKRRLIQPAFLDIVRNLLTPDGQLVIATDDASYAEHITEVIADYKKMKLAPNTFEFPDTGFHRRGLKLGNSVEIFTLRQK
jgi:tRNA (guanine-N7-)-methyltransferase